LTKLWTRILGLEEVGIHDNFFDLGGHSLLATQLLAWIRKDFGVELAVQDIFETPTICAISDKITKKKTTKQNEYHVVGILDEMEELSDQEAEILLQNHTEDPSRKP